jgi:hypothetical protein
VSEISRCSRDRVVPLSRGFSVFGSMITPRSPELYMLRSRTEVSIISMLLGSSVGRSVSLAMEEARQFDCSNRKEGIT